MRDNWKNTLIKSFLSKADNRIEVLPNNSYSLLGLSLEGRGLFVREQKLGSEISSNYLNRIIPGQFIYSRLFAWKGAFDFTREEFSNTYVSNEFPAFEIDKNKVNLKFLYYYFLQPKIWDEVEQYCMGVTKASRNRFKEEYFLNLKIPLPPLSEQKRIAAKIESIKGKIEAIQKIRAEQEKEIENLLYSKYTEAIEDAQWIAMKKVAPIVRRPVEIDVNESYPELGVRSFGKGTFPKPALAGIDVGSKRLFQIKSGDLIFSNVFAWEGAIAIVKEEDNNRYGSHRFISCVANEKIALTKFLLYHFLSPKGMEDINACSPGGAGRNKTLGLNKLMGISVPTPSLFIQKEFIELVNQTALIKQNYQQQETELTELLAGLLDKAFKGEL